MKKWLENYWYHYKWTTIIVLFFLTVAIICLTQIINKKQYDACIIYVGDDEITDTEYIDILSSFKGEARDYSGDGKIEINFSKLGYITDESNPLAGTVNGTAREFLSTLAVQQYYIYLMRKDVYLLYKESGVFVTLDEIFGDNIPEYAFDENSLYFNKTEFAKTNPGFENLSDDVVILIKNVPYSWNEGTSKAEKKSYENHLELFKLLVTG